MKKIFYGSYPQDKDSLCYPIIWDVVEETDMTYTLLSDRVLMIRNYFNDENKKAEHLADNDSAYWFDSQIRDELNGVFFYLSAFNKAERSKMISRKTGTATDKVWLPSISDITYWNLYAEDVLNCKPTPYAEKTAPLTYCLFEADSEFAPWWLEDQSIITTYGQNKTPVITSKVSYGVRPVIKVIKDKD